VPESTHGFKIDQHKCTGCLACMRSCPTRAIRVRHGKARLLPRLCIDCGSCLKVCGSGAIQATTRSFAEIGKYRFKVAVPSPVLFGQFPPGVSPAHVVAGLHSVGFDAVWDFAVELAIVNRAIAEYVETWKGPYPLLSVSCPVIVRLVQVLYPNMIDQLIRIQPPRELAGQELKRKYSEQLGIDRDDIAAIYITPCQAKTISILAPAEDAESNLEGALGISDLYNDVLAATRLLKHAETSFSWKDLLVSIDMLRWAMGVGQSRLLSRHRYMSVTGLANVIHVFDDIEKGKLRNIEYLECYACWGGCIGGNLTVDNIYVTLSKIHRLLAELPDANPKLEAKAEQRYRGADFALKGHITPRNTQPESGNLKQRVQRMEKEEAVMRALPGLDCGLCGAPTCETLAKDVAEGSARQDECVFLSDQRLRQLRKTYLRSE